MPARITTAPTAIDAVLCLETNSFVALKPFEEMSQRNWKATFAQLATLFAPDTRALETDFQKLVLWGATGVTAGDTAGDTAAINAS